MDSLQVAHSVSQVHRAIQNLPCGIDKTYDEIINRIQQQHNRNRALAFAVLSWIAFTCRPLSVTEICFATAMAMTPGITGLDSDDAIIETCLTSYCGGLVVVDEKTKIVRLVRTSPATLGGRQLIFTISPL